MINQYIFQRWTFKAISCNMKQVQSENFFHQKDKRDTKDVDLIYEKLLSGIKQPNINFSRYIGLKSPETFKLNFDNFNYGRGFHYFFDLKTFPRVKGSPSYALDINNRFCSTYKYDDNMLNGTRIGKILNRKYISIPSIKTTFQDKQSKDKNVCHYHLFAIEDQKYHNYRLISKYKYVLKNLQKLHQNDKLKDYTEIKKDIVTYSVCDKNLPIEKKKATLQKRIKVLEHRVKSMSKFWDWGDNTYYHFSLDQLFHNQAMLKGQKLTEQYLRGYILQRISYRKRYVEDISFGQFSQNHQKLRNVISTWLIFEEQENNALTTLMQNQLMALPKIIQMFRRNKQFVIFPLFTFNFGSKLIQRFIDPLIKTKMQKTHKNCFYVYLAFIKRVLKRNLACQQEEVVQPIHIEQYTEEMKLKILAIAKFYQKQIVTHKKILYADNIIQFKKLEDTPIEEKIYLLQPGHKIEISLKELMLLFFYRNISIALEQFMQYFKHDPEILKFMADENYNKFHYGIANIIHQPEFCILINDVQRFAEILSSQNTCPDLDKKLCFSFNEKLRIAYAWHEPISKDWELREQEQILSDPEPSKKVKI